MAEIQDNKVDIEDWQLLESDELFFPRDENGELIAKKVLVKVGVKEKKIKIKEKKKNEKDEILKDEKGNEIEDEIDKIIFEDIYRSILITPMPRGEWIEMIRKSKDGETTQDQDSVILEKHLIEPKVKAEDLIKTGKHFLINVIVSKILEYSSLMIDDSGKKKIEVR